MVHIKTEEQVQLMQEAALLVSKTLTQVATQLKPGMTTLDIDQFCMQYVKDHHATGRSSVSDEHSWGHHQLRVDPRAQVLVQKRPQLCVLVLQALNVRQAGRPLLRGADGTAGQSESQKGRRHADHFMTFDFQSAVPSPPLLHATDRGTSRAASPVPPRPLTPCH